MKLETRRAIGLMLLIDSAVLALLLLAAVIRLQFLYLDLQQMTYSRHLGEGVAVALLSGPFFVLICNLMDRAEGVDS